MWTQQNTTGQVIPRPIHTTTLASGFGIVSTIDDCIPDKQLVWRERPYPWQASNLNLTFSNT
ncbi:hypothetical protein P5673_019125 [Acropora cervicornis]|uniref:Uncharacterized protein n=1 Tax=Acropora cervicornis TaxID=6130 RepID=A0AAD9QBX8_ACRCE|nr:hypothetical protein P5673_019125 [Acropora cervicornis]